MTTINSKIQLALLKAKGDKSVLQKGFTLIELLVVVVILGVLSGVALPQLIGAKDAADEKASLSSASGMAKECANWVKFQPTGSTAPAYITNDLVTVSTLCSSANGGVYETSKTQNPKDGDLCVNDPKLSTITATKCTFTVDVNGGLTGAWG